jgi:hypothetical protein
MYDRPSVYEIEGSREVVVRISKANARRYPRGTATHLNGLRGYIVRCNEMSMWGGVLGRTGKAYKVRFHRPAKAWWGKFRINAWWFGAVDLRKTRA